MLVTFDTKVNVSVDVYKNDKEWWFVNVKFLGVGNQRYDCFVSRYEWDIELTILDNIDKCEMPGKIKINTKSTPLKMGMKEWQTLWGEKTILFTFYPTYGMNSGMKLVETVINPA